MRLLVSLGLVLFFTTSAAAELVAIEYEAVVNAVPPELAAVSTVGDPVSGRILYETTAADTDPDPTVGVYLGVTHEFHFGSFSGTSTGGFARIFDAAFDGFQVVDFDPADEVGEIGGVPVIRVTFALNGTTELYTSDALPDAPPLLTDPLLYERYAAITILPPGAGSTDLFASLTSVTVPEPVGATSLAVATLAALAGMRRVATRRITTAD